MSTVIVTGGAGYVGSHACKLLSQNGFTPVAVDNLSTGWRDAVKFGPFAEIDLLDKPGVLKVFSEYSPVAVLHFAALSQVGEAMHKPGLYWRNNVVGSLNLVEAAVEKRCKNFVFSSTCATYGDQDGVVLTENSPQNPMNAYGASKLAVEQILQNFAESDDLRHVIFRYFNVAGADPDGEVGEFHRPETHLIPLVLDTIDGKRDNLTVHGVDYDTKDGTCVRDYVHVMDLVAAHVQGLKWLLDGRQNAVFNLGTGAGFTVREVIENCKSVTNRDIPIIEGPRRDGDCTALVSGSDQATAKLGWTPEKSTLPQMIADAWRWHQNGHYTE